MAGAPPKLTWRIGEVVETRPDTPRTKSLFLEIPGWKGHKAGQHVDVRLTAEDGYQAQRSYSIASAPEDNIVELLIERLADGEVSSYLTDEIGVGDGLELRGPIGGWFAWEAREGGPLLLVAGGSGIAPLMAMIRHRHAVGHDTPVRLLFSSHTYEEVIFREELERLAAEDETLEITHTLGAARLEGLRPQDRRGDAKGGRLLPEREASGLRVRSYSACRGCRDGSRRARSRASMRQDRTLRTDWRITMDEHRLDGNAAAGVLAEIFTFEITTARVACVRCGAAGEVGAQMAYVSEIGTVVRCAACDNALIRMVRQDDGPQRYWLDLKGIEYLQLE